MEQHHQNQSSPPAATSAQPVSPASKKDKNKKQKSDVPYVPNGLSRLDGEIARLRNPFGVLETNESVGPKFASDIRRALVARKEDTVQTATVHSFLGLLPKKVPPPTTYTLSQTNSRGDKFFFAKWGKVQVRIMQRAAEIKVVSDAKAAAATSKKNKSNNTKPEVLDVMKFSVEGNGPNEFCETLQRLVVVA